VTATGSTIAGIHSAEDRVPPQLTRLIAFTLRAGVGLSAVLAIIGLGLLLTGSGASFSAATVHGAPFSGAGFVSGLAHGTAVDVLFLAFLVLIATPLVRVVISVVLFGRVGDRPFTMLTLTVMLLLGASVLIGALT
jgi:uncharacterized membrane protein